jgi:hypothetical protein
MNRSRLRITLAGLCAGAVVGLLFCSPAVGEVSPETWMRDLGPHLHYRKLTNIVIPGSHDTGTYGLDGSDWDYAGTQNQSETITAALDQGVRYFDLRVVYKDWGGNAGADYWARHSGYISGRLRFGQELDQIKDWTLAPGHEQEIILLNLSIDPAGHAFPSDTCERFDEQLGSALLTPAELQAAYGTTDPGQVTLGQLWSMPGHPRVILDNAECMDAGDPSAGQWRDVDGANVFGTYYASQCYASQYVGALWSGFASRPGIEFLVLKAAASRAGIGSEGDTLGSENTVGEPTQGDLYTLFIQATTTPDCGFPLRWFDLDADRTVLAALYDQWQTNPAIQAHLNIVAGDFVEETDLVKDVLAMDESFPERPDAVTRLGPERVVAEQDQVLPARSFEASVTYERQPAPDQLVNYVLSPSNGAGGGPSFGGSPGEVDVTDDTGLVDVSRMSAGPRVGTWTVNALALLPPPYFYGARETWTLVVVPSSKYTLQAVAGDPATVGVTRTLPGGFAARAVNAAGHPVPDAPVRFDAGSADGTFADGSKTATATTDADGIARSPAFVAGTHAGAMSISVTSTPSIPNLFLPVTVTPGVAAHFVPEKGDLQTTSINTLFHVLLTGHFTDAYGNVTTNMGEDSDHNPEPISLRVDDGSATWPNGSNVIDVKARADGTIQAPPLRAGKFLFDGSDPQRSLIVHAGRASFRGWVLYVAPGRPDAVEATHGDGQRTLVDQPFDHPLDAQVTDSEDHPIPGTEVTFAVTAGEASFPPLNRSLLAAVSGDRALADGPDPRRHSVTVLTDARGDATTPELTAGEHRGQIVVTASIGAEATTKHATFTLSATGVAPGAPSITDLSNGDGRVSVGFSGATDGTSPITSYEVTATDLTNLGSPPATAKGDRSPIVVSGLVNGRTYVFRVTATSDDGTSPPSAPSGRLNVGVEPLVVSGPADGVADQPYSSSFELKGAPPPTVTQVSGDLPPGLILSTDGTLTGTPTEAGSYTFTVRADNPVGIYNATVTITISPATS